MGEFIVDIVEVFLLFILKIVNKMFVFLNENIVVYNDII